VPRDKRNRQTVRIQHTVLLSTTQRKIDRTVNRTGMETEAGITKEKAQLRRMKEKINGNANKLTEMSKQRIIPSFSLTVDRIIYANFGIIALIYFWPAFQNFGSMKREKKR